MPKILYALIAFAILCTALVVFGVRQGFVLGITKQRASTVAVSSSSSDSSASRASRMAQVDSGETEGRLPPSAQKLPVGRTDVFMFDEGAGVDRQPALATLPSGGFVMVYSRYERGDIDSSGLRVVTSSDGNTISASEALPFGGEVEDAPSFVTTQEGTWLYFASSDSNLDNIKLWQSRLIGESFSLPDRLADVPGLRRLTQWPRWVEASPDTFLTFRGEKSEPYWLRLKDGIPQDVVLALASFGAAYPRVVPIAGHGCFFSYQKPPDGGYMATYFSVSPNCSNWSSPTALSWPEPPGKPDVHDAYALPRLDAGVDIYYVYPSRKGPGARFQVGFDLYRRAVMPDGNLGVEQRLTARDELNPFAPSAHRLPDGTILVTFSDIHASGNNGVSSSRLALFKLARDAPTLE